MQESEKIRITELALKSLEQQITKEEFAELDSFISSSKTNAHYFTTCIATYMGIMDYHELTGNSHHFDNTSFDADLWKQLAEEEKTAPGIEIPKQEPPQELIQKVVYQKSPYTISKFNLFTVLLSAAALIFMIIYVQLVPGNAIKSVAMVKGASNVQFAGNETITTGSRLTTRRDSYWLKNGILEIEFDYGAKVVIEAPAEFKLDTEERMTLNSGRLYAKVPGSAIGFMVDTPTSRVIDLGTEFGVKVDINGISEVHVIKGKVSLRAGTKDKHGTGEIIAAGQARCVSNERRIAVIPMRLDKFSQSTEERLISTMNFEGLSGNTLPSGWKLIDNNGTGIGPDYTNLANGGPSGAGDTCGRVGPADGSLVQGPNETPGGWIQCLEPFDCTAGFQGGFDFCLGNTKNGPDAQFLFGDISEGARNYHYVAISNLILNQKFFTVTDGIRKVCGKFTAVSNLTPEVWYHCRFKFVPVQGTTGQFSYAITDLAANKVFCSLQDDAVTLPETLTFGFGNYNDTACFDNIRISSLSISGDTRSEPFYKGK